MASPSRHIVEVAEILGFNLSFGYLGARRKGIEWRQKRRVLFLPWLMNRILDFDHSVTTYSPF
jgi:hypothetical protein